MKGQPINKNAKVVGSQFVKPITHGGSPHAEEAASKAQQLLGVPHNPVKAQQLPEGGWAAVSPALQLTTLTHLKPDYESQHFDELNDRNRLGQLALSDFITGTSDRHGGNYVHVPGKGVLSIDHGDAWHPSNAMWPRLDRGEGFADMFSLADSPYYWAEGPNTSAFGTYVLGSSSRHPERPKTYAPAPIDPALIDRALQHRDQLEQLAYEGTRDFPEEERALARLAVRLRLNTLERLRPKNTDELHNAMREVHAEADKTFGRRGKR